ncbi:hypothetical protein RKD55_004709 [Rossellomorea marisflavi]
MQQTIKHRRSRPDPASRATNGMKAERKPFRPCGGKHRRENG